MPVTVYDAEKPLSDADLDAVERRLSIVLPKQYRAWLLKHNGGRPDPGAFDYRRQSGPYSDGVVAWFFAVYEGEFENFETEYRNMKLGKRRRLPAHLVPIARDPFGNVICLSFGGDDKNAVYLWDHEEEPVEPSYANCHLIANSFDEFIAGLRD